MKKAKIFCCGNLKRKIPSSAWTKDNFNLINLKIQNLNGLIWHSLLKTVKTKEAEILQILWHIWLCEQQPVFFKLAFAN